MDGTGQPGDRACPASRTTAANRTAAASGSANQNADSPAPVVIGRWSDEAPSGRRSLVEAGQAWMVRKQPGQRWQKVSERKNGLEPEWYVPTRRFHSVWLSEKLRVRQDVLRPKFMHDALNVVRTVVLTI